MRRREIPAKPTKVERYRPGVVPKFAQPEKTDDIKTFTTTDPRLARIEQAKASNKPSGRTRYEAKVLLEEQENKTTVESRQKLKELALQRQQEEPAADEDDDEEFAYQDHQGEAPLQIESEEESEDEESEDEESIEESEEDEPIRPVFIPKSQRMTTSEKLELEEAEALNKEKQLEKLRREESQKLVEKVVKYELSEETKKVKDPSLIDDTDGVDQDAEYEEWKLRELYRLKRDKAAKEEREREKEEIEKVRNMTEKEREEYLNRPKKVTKKKMAFLQKYYHKGAFFLDEEEDILKRDYSEPTLEDRVNKEVLPKVLQVKNFGKSSRSKWTHLANEDTSSKEAGWNNRQTQEKLVSKMGGMKGGFSRPSSKK